MASPATDVAGAETQEKSSLYVLQHLCYMLQQNHLLILKIINKK